MDGPNILEDEINMALHGMSYGRAAEEEGTTTEMMTTADFLIKSIPGIANEIYDSGYIPEDMKENIFIAILK